MDYLTAHENRIDAEYSVESAARRKFNRACKASWQKYCTTGDDAAHKTFLAERGLARDEMEAAIRWAGDEACTTTTFRALDDYDLYVGQFRDASK